MAWARRALPNVLAAALVGALVFAYFGHAFLNYDTFYALVWGDELAGGLTPQYDTPVAPTPHPLAIAAGVLASRFGDAGEGVMLALALFAIGWIAVGLYRLGREAFAWPVGGLAAVIFAPRGAPPNFGTPGCPPSTSAYEGTSTCRRSRSSYGRPCSRHAGRGAAGRCSCCSASQGCC